MTKKKKTSRLAEALVETAGDMHKAGLLDQAGYDKITMRHLGMAGVPKLAPITATQIRAMRERPNRARRCSRIISI